jgi:hypothetical protein
MELATRKELIAANPDAPPPGSVLPFETYEKCAIDECSGSVGRARLYLLQRAENSRTYHDSKMTLELGEDGDYITLKASHVAKD